MPLGVRRMRRTGGQEGRPGLFAKQGMRSEKGRSRRIMGQTGSLTDEIWRGGRMIIICPRGFESGWLDGSVAE